MEFSGSCVVFVPSQLPSPPSSPSVDPRSKPLHEVSPTSPASAPPPPQVQPVAGSSN